MATQEEQKPQLSYEERKNRELHHLRKWINDLKEEANELVEETKQRADKELSALEGQWQQAKSHLENLGDTAGDTLDEVVKKADDLWGDLGVHYKKVITTMKEVGKVFEDQWEFYEDEGGKWRWRRFDKDQQIVGSSHKGFDTRDESLANARRHGYVDLLK